MTQIPLEPHLLWPLLAIGGFAFVLLPVLLTADWTQEFTFGLREKLGLSTLWQPLFMLAVLLWLLIFVALVFGLLAQLCELIWFLAPESTIKQTEARFALVRLTAMTATLGAVVALPFTLVKVNLTREANETATESLFNDKLNAATDDLHAMRKRWDGEQNIWEDDITRRNAAIDRLEGLANERPDVAPRISRLLCVYVRELSRECPAEEAPDDGTAYKYDGWANKLTARRSDMENASQVLGRLKEIPGVNPASISINLRNTNLQGFELNGLNFDGANFSGAKMQGARLSWTKLRRANLNSVELQCGDLTSADLRDSRLDFAKMASVILVRTQMQRAVLSYSDLVGAHLSSTNLKSSDFQNVIFSNAIIGDVLLDQTTIFLRATFTKTLFSGTDFSSSTIALDQLQQGFGDATNQLPGGQGPESDDWPEHWPKTEHDWFDLFEEAEIWWNKAKNSKD